MKRNEIYFDKYCDIASWLLSRQDIENPAVKSVIRHTIREAINHATDLPGHDNKKGAGLVSEAAARQIERGCLTDLVGEHVVPISVIGKKLVGMRPLAAEDIKRELKAFSKRAVITKEEDDRLRTAGLVKQMPQGWDGVSWTARYDAVGISLVNESYAQLIKASSRSERSPDKGRRPDSGAHRLIDH